MSWKPFKKPKTKDYECIFFNVDGEEHRFEIPFRPLDLTSTKITTSFGYAADGTRSSNQWQLKKRKTIIGEGLLDDFASLSVIGDKSFRTRELSFTICAKENTIDQDDREKRYLEDQQRYHEVNCSGVSRIELAKEVGVPHCYIVKNHIDIFLDSEKIDELYENIVFGEENQLWFSIQFWKIYCKNDFEFQKDHFQFLLCPSENGDVSKPQIAEGRLRSLDLTKSH